MYFQYVKIYRDEMFHILSYFSFVNILFAVYLIIKITFFTFQIIIIFALISQN